MAQNSFYCHFIENTKQKNKKKKKRWKKNIR